MSAPTTTKPLKERRFILKMKGWSKVDMDNLETYIKKMHIKNGRAEVISLEPLEFQ